MTGEDYEEISLPISFSDNQSTVLISIPILDDMLAEGLETVGGILEVVSQSLNVSSVSRIEIQILDNEGMLSL